MLTFENVLSPILFAEYDAYYACTTLRLKMLTDWPECNPLDWEKDLQAIFSLAEDEMGTRLFDQTIVDAVRKIPESELAVIGPWERRYVELLRKEYLLHGYEPDPRHNKNDKKQQKLNMQLFYQATQYGRKYLNSILYDDQHLGVTTVVRDRKQLECAPPKALRILAGNCDPEEGPWVASPRNGSIFEMLKYCSARPQKEKLWEAWIARSSFDCDEHIFNNSLNIEEFRCTYEEIANQMKFRSMAHYQLANKMVGNPETLREFIAGLYHCFRPIFIQRFDDWKNYAEETEGIQFGELCQFDLFYIARREAEHCYGVDTLELMRYFPSWQTFEKMLSLASIILGIQFKDITDQASSERCHPSIRIYEVSDKNSLENLGRFYVDPFARQGKVVNKWVAQLWRVPDKARGLDKLVWMVGNMEEVDISGRPTMLHYEEIQEMLEAFGRALQYFISQSPIHLLSITRPSVSMDWDASDFLPTFMLFLLYKPLGLMALSSNHQETGEPLAKQYARDVSLALARSTFWDTWRTLFWADYDLSLFEIENFQDKYYLDLYKEMFQEYFPFPREPNNYQPCSFMPIFTPIQMACMYYRKLWCETLALDVHQAFDNEDNISATGERLKSTWLNHGMLKPQWDMYMEFQGREPNIIAISNFHDPPSNTPLLEEAERKFAQLTS